MRSSKRALSIEDAYLQAEVKLAQTRCIEPERLAVAVAGALPANETQRIIDHCSLCASCAQEWRACRQVHEVLVIESSDWTPAEEAPPCTPPRLSILPSEPTDNDSRNRPKRSTPFTKHWWTPLAVAACIAVVWNLHDITRDAKKEKVFRGEPGQVSALYYTAESGVFHWTKKTKVNAPCRVSIWDSNLHLLATLESNSSSAEISGELREKLNDLKRFVWQIECYEEKRGWMTSRSVIQGDKVK